MNQKRTNADELEALLAHQAIEHGDEGQPELRPCPNPACGNEHPHLSLTMHWVYCHKCRLIGPERGIAIEAIAAWNALPRREDAKSPSVGTEAMIAEMRGVLTLLLSTEHKLPGAMLDKIDAALSTSAGSELLAKKDAELLRLRRWVSGINAAWRDGGGSITQALKRSILDAEYAATLVAGGAQ